MVTEMACGVRGKRGSKSGGDVLQLRLSSWLRGRSQSSLTLKSDEGLSALPFVGSPGAVTAKGGGGGGEERVRQ